MTRTDVVVVGGGMAGLTAALRVAEAGFKCTALTGITPGGLLLGIESIQGLPEHPEGVAGYELGPLAQEAAMNAGVEFIGDEASALEPAGEGWVVRSSEGPVTARAVILAPGSAIRTLGVPGEERLYGKGVSHCASCDAPMLRGGAVVVVGGGDAACQEALTLAPFSNRVIVLVRGAALRARAWWRERIAAEPKIEVRFGAVVAEVLGDDSVRGVRLASGGEVAADAVFVYPGLAPTTAWLGGAVPLEADGRITVDGALRTGRKGLFAAGSVRAASSGQAVEAIADGGAAAASAVSYLRGGAWPA